MSTPQHPHHLRREQEKGAGGEYVAARYAQMRCDGGPVSGCRYTPKRAPRLVVPPRPLDFLYEPILKFTTLHYCELHAPKCSVAMLLASHSAYGRGTAKTDIERIARHKWPHGYTPDFDNATIEMMLVTTPEYRRFLEYIEESSGVLVDPWQGVPVL